MKITELSADVSVSDQLHAEDIPVLAEQGFELIICNRPDNEAADQPAFAEIAEVAKAQQMDAVSIAFTGGQMTAEQVALFKTALGKGKKTLAYCRTGNRSTQIFKAAQESTPVAETPVVETNSVEASHQAAKPHFQVVIVGAGSGGIAAAASLLKRNASLRICLIDPAEYHAYQPGWTMVGGGVFDVKTTRRDMASVIPAQTTWMQKAVEEFDPEANKVILADGSEVYYDQLVVSAGLKLHWAGIEGLEETLGRNGVTSNYLYDYAPYTWELVSNLKSGKAVFTQPPMPIKCAGAPQKAMYLASSHWEKAGVLNNIDVSFYNAGGVLFGVKDYVPALEKYVDRYDIKLNLLHTLKRVDGDNKTAYFEHKPAEGEATEVVTEFDMLHVCPPQCAPDFIRNSPLVDDAGWVDVDQFSLQHKKYPNVWGLGDVTNTPNAKTMAAARKQAPVLAQNICEVMDNREPDYAYDGYGSCPLTVERGKIVLAEFGYGGKLLPSFPDWVNKGTEPSARAWKLKADFLPWFYWNGMLKGREWLAAPEKKQP